MFSYIKPFLTFVFSFTSNKRSLLHKEQVHLYGGDHIVPPERGSAYPDITPCIRKILSHGHMAIYADNFFSSIADFFAVCFLTSRYFYILHPGP